MDENPYESPGNVKPTDPQPAAPRPSGLNRMDGPELFGVLVKIVGLYFILTGMVYAIAAMFNFGGLIRTPVVDPWTSARGAVEYLAPGIVAFFFSKKIVRLAYSDEREQQSEES